MKIGCASPNASCRACHVPSGTYYLQQGGAPGTCADRIESASFTVDAQRLAKVSVQLSFGEKVMLTGPLACDGPSTLKGSGNDPQSGCKVDVSAVVTVVGTDATHLGVQVTSHVTCPGQPADTCSGSFDLKR